MANYELRSPVLIEGYGKNYEQNVTEKFGIGGLSFTQLQELRNAIEESDPELAPYLDEGSDLHGVVLSIRVGIDEKEAVTRVETTRELTKNEIEELEDYVSGQYSDGWGEGFEQFHFSEFDEEVEIYDEDEDEYYTEDEIFELFASFWFRHGFKISTTKVG